MMRRIRKWQAPTTHQGNCFLTSYISFDQCQQQIHCDKSNKHSSDVLCLKTKKESLLNFHFSFGAFMSLLVK